MSLSDVKPRSALIGERKCKRCGIAKSISEFYTVPKTYCKLCAIVISAEYRARKASKRPSAWVPKYKTPGYHADRARKAYHANPGRAARYHRKSRYGIIDDPPSMCEACGVTVSAERRPGAGICLDHDHVTGKFRGWLCFSCNIALGHLGDDPTKIESLLKYLQNKG